MVQKMTFFRFQAVLASELAPTWVPKNESKSSQNLEKSSGNLYKAYKTFPKWLRSSKTWIWLLNSAARRTCASTAWLIFHKCTKNVCTVVGVSLAGTTLDAAFRETRPAEASGLRAHYFFITYLPSQDLLQSTIRELCASAWLAATWLKRRSMAADDALALFRQHYFLYLLPVEAHHLVTQHGLHARWKYENKFWHH